MKKLSHFSILYMLQDISTKMGKEKYLVAISALEILLILVYLYFFPFFFLVFHSTMKPRFLSANKQDFCNLKTEFLAPNSSLKLHFVTRVFFFSGFSLSNLTPTCFLNIGYRAIHDICDDNSENN